jgi:Trk K+ transport system NAD-binding subunit
MAKTLTGRTPKQELVLIARLIDGLSYQYNGKIQKEIVRAMRDGARIYETTGLLDAILPKHESTMTKIMNRLYADTAAFMVQARARKKDNMTLVMASWALRYGSEKILRITRTTMNDIKNIIKTGIEDGLSVASTAKLIREAAPSIANARSKTISQTEIHQASQVVSFEIAKYESEEFGFRTMKEWVAAGDARDAHHEANGQQVAMNESFEVGGEELMYPGDPNGSPENVINCRCVMAYITL